MNEPQSGAALSCCFRSTCWTCAVTCEGNDESSPCFPFPFLFLFFCAPRGRLWPWPLALACGKCLAIHTREEESLLCCRLLFCLINFYIRYTSLKMPRMCVCHCFGLFLAIERNLVIEQGKCGSNEICVRDFARRGNLMACKRSTACIIH